jgi:hypothetical protein
MKLRAATDVKAFESAFSVTVRTIKSNAVVAAELFQFFFPQIKFRCADFSRILSTRQAHLMVLRTT